MPQQGFLSGYKTYITAGATIVLSFLAFAVGDEVAGQEVLDMGELMQMTATALIGIFLRHGMANGGNNNGPTS